MCGRFTLTVDQEALSTALGVEVLLADHPRPRFNIAPTQEVPVWTGTGVRPLRWGLVPAWAGDASGAGRLINARAETVATKPSFRDPFRTGRCLVPADGFYEWVPGDREGSSGSRTPWWIHLPGRPVFTFAGIHTRWVPPGGGPDLETFALLTCDAVAGIRDLHHRMPVVVVPHLRTAWVEGSPETGLPTGEEADLLLHRVLEAARDSAGQFRAHPVTTRVNRPDQDHPSLVEPAPGDEGGPPPLQASLFD
jgi:putative SOS response-associated peptidase YedK